MHALTHLRYSDGEILILPRYGWCSPERCSPRLMCVSVCVGSVAAVLLLWHVDTALPPVSASGLHFCRLGRLPDSCFGIALRLLFPSEASQVSSYTSPVLPLSLFLFLSLSFSLSTSVSPSVLSLSL